MWITIHQIKHQQSKFKAEINSISNIYINLINQIIIKSDTHESFKNPSPLLLALKYTILKNKKHTKTQTNIIKSNIIIHNTQSEETNHINTYSLQGRTQVKYC